MPGPFTSVDPRTTVSTDSPPSVWGPCMQYIINSKLSSRYLSHTVSSLRASIWRGYRLRFAELKLPTEMRLCVHDRKLGSLREKLGPGMIIPRGPHCLINLTTYPNRIFHHGCH